MKTRHLLVTTLAFTLPAWSLSAQENTPPPRPPDTTPREGAPRGENPQRPVAGLFGALDANHDGVIDNEEANRAADVLRKLDRNSDGKIGADEFRGPDEGQPRRPEGGEARKREGDQRPPGTPDAGPRRESPRPEGDRERRPDGDRREPRGPDLRAEGRGEQNRERGPEMHHRHDRKPDGDQKARPENNGPRREGPPADSRREGGDQRDNREAAPRGDSGPQARHHHGRHHHSQGPSDSRMTQGGPKPEHNRIGEESRGPQSAPQRGQENRYARGPAPQQWNRDARPPQGPSDGNCWAQSPRGPQQQFAPEPRRFEPNRGQQRPSWQHSPRKSGPPPQGFQPREDRGPDRPPQGPPPGSDGPPRGPQRGASFDQTEEAPAVALPLDQV